MRWVQWYQIWHMYTSCTHIEHTLHTSGTHLAHILPTPRTSCKYTNTKCLKYIYVTVTSFFYIYVMATSVFYIYVMATSFIYIYVMATSFFYIYIDIYINIYFTFTNWQSIQSFYWTPFLNTSGLDKKPFTCKTITDSFETEIDSFIVVLVW